MGLRGRISLGALRGATVEACVAATLVAIIGVTSYRWGLLSGRPIAPGAATLLVWLGYYAMAFASAPAFDYFSERASTGRKGVDRSTSGAATREIPSDRAAGH
jgi:hypothetical protein